jgi:hypothetical protein
MKDSPILSFATLFYILEIYAKENPDDYDVLCFSLLNLQLGLTYPALNPTNARVWAQEILS